VSAGLAIALRTPIVNLAVWLFIISRRPFEVGDRVEIGNTRGDVIDQRIFMFSMMEIGNWVDADQSTGRVIHLPNGLIFSEVLANYSKGFKYLWDEVVVLITFESNWEKAKNILDEIASKHGAHVSDEAERKVKEAARKFMIFCRKLTPRVYTSVKDSGVMLSMRHLAEPHQRRGIQEAIWEDVLEAFSAENDIDLAFRSATMTTVRRGKRVRGPHLTDPTGRKYGRHSS
jgi:small-conductance mechanosensitive channel